MQRLIRAWLPLALLLTGVLMLLGAHAQENNSDNGPADVRVMEMQGAIGPAISDWFSRTLSTANEERADLLVVELDTPGGLDNAMRDMIKEILSSDVPVAFYVTPRGARAASAGTYLLYASHVAAMAPATNLGSATPVQMGGGGGSNGDDGGMPFSVGLAQSNAINIPFDLFEEEEEEEAAENGNGADNGDAVTEEVEDALPDDPDDLSAMEKKVINDAVSYIRGLAELRGRNADWAERAVREAVNLSSSEALEKNVIDIRADNLEDLLEQANGMEVDVDGTTITLMLDDYEITRVEQDWRTQFLTVITDPSVAYILLIIGIYGLILEFYNPGMGVPGVVGAICLLIGLYALQMLPISYVGLGLILLGIGLMVVEAFNPSFGILGLGGAVSFIVGSIMLMDTDLPGFQIAMPLIAALAVSTIVIMVFVLRMALQARKKTIVSGSEGMVGSTAVAMKEFENGSGYVRALGEMWKAQSKDPIQEGDVVRVESVEGLKLKVVKAEDQNT